MTVCATAYRAAIHSWIRGVSERQELILWLFNALAVQILRRRRASQRKTYCLQQVNSTTTPIPSTAMPPRLIDDIVIATNNVYTHIRHISLYWSTALGASLESCCTGTNIYPRPHSFPWTWNPSPTILVQTCPHPHPLPHKLLPSPSLFPYITACPVPIPIHMT